MEAVKKIFSYIGKTINYIQNHFKAMLFLLFVALLFVPASEDELTPNNLQQINLIGAIMDPSEVLEQIQKAQKDDKIKGVLLNVNSPGGAVAPSVEISYAIKRLREKKPVVVYASGTIASGSYYASIWADEIVANPGSMVGSIGVIMEGADLSGIMKKIGIKTQTVQAGKYKKVGTSDRAWKTYEVKELNKVIQGTYNMFVHDVAKARKLNIKKKDTFANAHIFTASQAKKVGLIDIVGVKHDAKARLVKLSGVLKPVWNKEDKFDKLMKKLSASSAAVLQTYFPSVVLK